jgi:DNA polymerase-3 subunit delta'
MKNSIILPPLIKHNDVSFGHEKAYNALMHSFTTGRMHHAWLIYGHKGIGKSTLIYQFVKEILVKYDKDALKKINNNSHPDLMIIEKKEAAKEISIDEIRKINNFMHLTAANSPYKIVIIDNCEELNNNSANALLKILEEPPKNSFIFLISHNTGKLPLTIISRCRKLRLNDLNYNQATEILNGLDNDNDNKNELLKLSNNSVSITLDLIKLNGLNLYQQILNSIDNIEHNLPSQINMIEDRISKSNQGFEIFSLLINNFLKKIIYSKLNLTDDLALTINEQNLINKFNENNDIDQLITLYDEIQAIFYEAKFSHLDNKQIMFIIFNLLKST